MAHLKWLDTTDDEEPRTSCRAIGCRRRRLWEIETSDDSGNYSDLVCLFHLAAYIVEFIELTTGGHVRIEMERWVPHMDRQAIGLARGSMRVRGTTIYPGDISAVLGEIPVRE